VIAPAEGKGLTTIVELEELLPQAVDKECVMTVLPGNIAVTIPKGLTVATDGLLLLHIPPLIAGVATRDAPTQIVVDPVVKLALGVGFTVMFLVENADPQLLVTV
jgi:hypothetical protein